MTSNRDHVDGLVGYEAATESNAAARTSPRKRLMPVLTAVLLAAGAGCTVQPSRVDRTVSCVADTRLHQAAQANDANLAEKLLDADANVDVKNDVGVTPLVLAVRSGSGRTAGVLLAHNASIDPLDTKSLRLGLENGGAELRRVLVDHRVPAAKWGTEDLCRALSEGDVAFALFLVEGGVALTGGEGGRHSALHSAALHPANATAVKVLLSKGQDVNGDDHERRGDRPWHSGTPLALAVVNENWEIAKILLEAGADASSTRHGQTDLLARAVHANRKDVVKLMIDRGAAVNVRVSDRTRDPARRLEGTPLLLAVRNRNNEIAEMLIQAGADPNVIDDAQTTYKLIAESGNVELVKLLLEKTQTPPARMGGRLFLNAAVRSGNVEMATLVIEHCSKDPQILSARRDTEVVGVAFDADRREMARMLVEGGGCFRKGHIHSAWEKGWDDVATTMIDKGATGCLDWGDLTGTIDLACRHGKLDAAERLLKEHLRSTTVRDTLKWAAEHRKSHVIKLLMKHTDPGMRDGAAPWLLAQAAAKGQASVVETLCEGGVNVNRHNQRGMPPLWYAVQSRSLDTVMVLIKHKANLKRVKGEWTVLSLAANVGTLECAKALVEAGCPVRGHDKDAWTPLHAAANARNVELVGLLIAKGADVNVLYQEKWTPMDAAFGRRASQPAWMRRIAWTDRPHDQTAPSLKDRQREYAENRGKLIALLAEHGGKRYRDLKENQRPTPGPW